MSINLRTDAIALFNFKTASKEFNKEKLNRLKDSNS